MSGHSISHNQPLATTSFPCSLYIYQMEVKNGQPPGPMLSQTATVMITIRITAIPIHMAREFENRFPAISFATAAMNSPSEGGVKFDCSLSACAAYGFSVTCWGSLSKPVTCFTSQSLHHKLAASRPSISLRAIPRIHVARRHLHLPSPHRCAIISARPRSLEVP